MRVKAANIRVPIILIILLLVAALALIGNMYIGSPRPIEAQLQSHQPNHNPTPPDEGEGPKTCPPQAVYGVGQPPDKGCGNRPPPGQEDTP